MDTDASTLDSGASIQRSTNLGQKTYVLHCGSGGEDAYRELGVNSQEYLGKKATLVLKITVQQSVYTVSVTRYYMPEVEVETSG